MITRERAQEIFENYEHNIDVSVELDEKILGEFDFNNWPAFLEERSAQFREMFSTNKETLANLNEDLKSGLDEDTAEILYEILFEMYENAYDDPYIYELIGTPLIAFYEEHFDVEKLVVLYHLLAFEISEYNWGTAERVETLTLPVAYYKNVVELQDHYAEIENPRVRRFFFTAYCNLIAPLSQTNVYLREEVFDLYDAAHELWNRKEVQALDADNEDILATLAQMDEDILFVEGYFDQLSEEGRAKYVALAEKILAQNESLQESMSGICFRTKQVREGYLKEKTPLEILEEATREFESLAEVDYEFLRNTDEAESEEETPDLQEAYQRQTNLILNHHNLAVTIADHLRELDVSEEMKKAYADRFLPKMMSVYTNIPYHFETSMTNEICMEGYMEMSSLIQGLEEKKTYLKKMIISRQPITLIHSKMVARIAVEIADELLWKYPERFVEPCGYASVDEVRTHREDILQYIIDCGLLHDVGKMCLVNVINQQSRPLSDREFGMIREHPKKGPEVLRNDPDFAPYMDIILGHHKFYDGNGGYPADFDNTVSPKRFLIDLITIADCMDAATDILGRNYAHGKNFDMLLEELKRDAGTRYNPEIVAVIAENPRLQEELSELTVGGRYSIYYEAYQEIRQL